METKLLQREIWFKKKKKWQPDLQKSQNHFQKGKKIPKTQTCLKGKHPNIADKVMSFFIRLYHPPTTATLPNRFTTTTAITPRVSGIANPRDLEETWSDGRTFPTAARHPRTADRSYHDRQDIRPLTYRLVDLHVRHAACRLIVRSKQESGSKLVPCDRDWCLEITWTLLIVVSCFCLFVWMGNRQIARMYAETALCIVGLVFPNFLLTDNEADETAEPWRREREWRV